MPTARAIAGKMMDSYEIVWQSLLFGYQVWHMAWYLIFDGASGYLQNFILDLSLTSKGSNSRKGAKPLWA